MTTVRDIQYNGSSVEDDLARTFLTVRGEIPLEFALGEPIDQDYYLVGGEFRAWNGPMTEVVSPIFCREGDDLVPTIIGRYPSLGENEAIEVLQAAVTAYGQGDGPWPSLSTEERCRYLEVFANRMMEVRETVVNLLMWEIGKTLPDARKEFDRTVAYIRDTVEATRKLDRDSSALMREDGVIAQVRRAPLGVVLCMGPFNYPLNETFTTLIPALIMGNVVIMKPPKLGVMLHSPLLKIFKEVFPAGVVNTIYGDGPTVVGPMMASGDVDVLAFIGTSKVADILKKQSPKPHRMRSVLGLEAKNPAIIMWDADLDVAVKECLAGSLGYNGQRCTALKIIFVHRSKAEKFTKKFVWAVEQLHIGMPWTEGVDITPLPEEHKCASMNELIRDALTKGANILNAWGGRSVESLMVPAVMFPVKEGMRLYDEEQFGPIVPIVVYDDLKEVLAYIRNSKYGQQASVFGNDEEMIGRLVDRLTNQVCRVNINCQCQRGPDVFPFTGRKDSAEGTLSVFDALRAFSIRSMVATKSDSINECIIARIRGRGFSEFLSIR